MIMMQHDPAIDSKRRNITPLHCRKFEMRQAACDRSYDLNPMPAEVPDRTRRYGSGNRDKRPRHSWRKAAKQKKRHHDNG